MFKYLLKLCYMRSKPVEEQAKMLSALGDTSRFKIFKLLLSKKDICVSEIADEIGISVPGVSQHLKILESAELVAPERRGQTMCYQVKKENSFVRSIIKLFM